MGMCGQLLYTEWYQFKTSVYIQRQSDKRVALHNREDVS